MVEKREHVRLSVKTSVSYQLPDGEHVQADCNDISVGGAFVRTDRPLPFGAKFKLTLELAAPVTIDVTVRWTKPDGMGVQFGLMGALETHALVKLISG